MGRSFLFILSAAFFFGLIAGKTNAEGRQTIDLDGDWKIAQGKMDAPPQLFDRKVPVPGLVDMALPAFEEVGVKSPQREAFWYRKVFRIKGDVPAVATLRVAKAFFGTRVYLNGQLVGEHLPLFTPGYFDLKKELKGRGASNDLVIRVGANPEAIPVTIPRGLDGEKSKYIPGIFDSVQLILSGTPNLLRVQAAPDITRGSVHVQALLQNAAASTPVTFTVKETASGIVVGTATNSEATVAPDRGKNDRCRYTHCSQPSLVARGSLSLHARGQDAGGPDRDPLWHA